MELVVLDEDKSSMTFELKGEAHTFPHLLCWALLKDPKVDVAVYDNPHPLIGVPKIQVKTKGKLPRNALKDALKLIQGGIKSASKILSKK